MAALNFVTTLTATKDPENSSRAEWLIAVVCILAEIKTQLAKVRLPVGVQVREAGFGKNQNDVFSSLFLAVGLGILLIYLIMVTLYESIVYPFVVLFSLPVAIIGAILALALTLNTVNLLSILGIIMLLGLVAKNAILIVDFTNQEKEKGMSVKDALIAAGREGCVRY